MSQFFFSLLFLVKLGWAEVQCSDLRFLGGDTYRLSIISIFHSWQQK